MAGLDDINAALPPGTETPTYGPNRIRALEAKTIEFAAVEHALAGPHQFLVGPLASRPAAGYKGRFYIITTTGLADDLQYDTGSAWVSLTNGPLIDSIVAAILAHRIAAIIDHPDLSVTSIKIALGAILKKHLDGTNDNTNISALVDGGSADALHGHDQYFVKGAVSPGDLTGLTPTSVVTNTPRYGPLILAKVKELRANHGGTITVSWDVVVGVIETSGTGTFNTRIFKNSIAWGVLHSTSYNLEFPGTTHISEDLVFSAGDSIELWAQNAAGFYAVTTYNFGAQGQWDFTTIID